MDGRSPASLLSPLRMYSSTSMDVPTRGSTISAECPSCSGMRFRKSQEIVDYYRGPGTLAGFRLAGRLSADPGYFCFGPETICYGNSSSGFRSKQVIGPLYDALTDVTIDGGTVRLPLDPHEIIETLRHERYRNNGDRSRTGLGDSAMVRNFYYWLRPFLPVAIRKHLQRARLSDWRKIPFPHL